MYFPLHPYFVILDTVNIRYLMYNSYLFSDVDAESEDELYEVVNITDYARRHQWWSRVFGNSTGPIAEKYSVASQIMMGGVTGWLVIKKPMLFCMCCNI